MTIKLNFKFRRVNLQDEGEVKFLAEVDMTIPAKFDKDFVINEQMTLDRAKFLKSVNDNDFFEVAIDENEKIVGFHVVKKVPHFEKFAGRIDTLWVSPNCRKHGLASGLKKHAEAWAIEHNLDHLHTWVHSDNTKMISINKRMGYKIVNYKMPKDKSDFIDIKNLRTTIDEKAIPTLDTDRLVLRAFNMTDAKEVQRLAGNPKIAETTANIPHPYTDGVAEEWIAKHQDWFKKGLVVSFAIVIKASEKLIGNISLMIDKTNQKAEIGYWIGEEFWNKGYCTEATQSVIGYAFNECKLNKITSRHMMSNPSSGKVMLKSGMKQEGFLKDELFKNDRFYDVVVFGLLKSEWLNK